MPKAMMEKKDSLIQKVLKQADSQQALDWYMIKIFFLAQYVQPQGKTTSLLWTNPDHAHSA